MTTLEVLKQARELISDEERAAVAVLPGMEVGAGPWQVRNRLDSAVNALADRHYSRRRPFSGQVGPPGRKLILVTPCERALWLTHWPYAEMAMDGLDAWRCSIFRNEGAGLSSELILAAMETTAKLWADRPRDGWVTWVDCSKVDSAHPGYCFKKAGWSLDREYEHPRLLRFRTAIAKLEEERSAQALSEKEGR